MRCIGKGHGHYLLLDIHLDHHSNFPPQAETTWNVKQDFSLLWKILPAGRRDCFIYYAFTPNCLTPMVRIRTLWMMLFANKIHRSGLSVVGKDSQLWRDFSHPTTQKCGDRDLAVNARNTGLHHLTHGRIPCEPFILDIKCWTVMQSGLVHSMHNRMVLQSCALPSRTWKDSQS